MSSTLLAVSINEETYMNWGKGITPASAIARSKIALKMARGVAGYGKSQRSLADALSKIGVDVSAGTVSRYEKEPDALNSLSPTLEYIIGLHILSGVSLDVLCGILEWGDVQSNGIDDPEIAEIVRMMHNMPRTVSIDLKSVTEIILYALYTAGNASKLEDIKEMMGIGDD